MTDRKPFLLTLKAAAVALALVMTGPFADVRAEEAKSAEAASRLPQDVVTEHSLELPGRTLKFNATAGSLPITNSKGAVLAEIGYVSYTLNGMPAGQRPATFVLNGGPGAASSWLHIGSLGPWRIRMEKAAASPSAPAPLLPNAETWLDFTDLVFIDPVGTGFSQMVTDADGQDQHRERRRTGRSGSREKGGPSYFWSLDGDIATISEFIQKWTYRNDRLTSPKLYVGESYGGFRGPKIARELHSEHGIALNALILVSPVLDFASRRYSHPPLAYVGLLPSLAAAEMERHDESVTREVLKDVEEYARSDYLEDLMRGPRNAAAMDRIAAKVSEITGLSQQTVRRYAGRISGRIYSDEVNQPKGRIASLYDASITSLDPEPYARRSRYRDPFTTALNAPMTSAMLELYGSKLAYRTELPYENLSGRVNRNWIWGNSLSPPESVSELSEQLALDKRLRVLVVHGFTDLVTPYFTSELVLDQLPAFGDRPRVTSIVYPGGHMFYSRDRSRKSFREDAFNLVERIIIETNEIAPAASEPESSDEPDPPAEPAGPSALPDKPAEPAGPAEPALQSPG